MMLRAPTEHPAGAARELLRARALRSAIILRDCSFRIQSTGLQRRACRTLMRRQAAEGRQPRDGGWSDYPRAASAHSIARNKSSSATLAKLVAESLIA